MANPSQTPQPPNRPLHHYSYVLRCIGQSLEGLELKSLEVKTQGDNFIVQGWKKKASIIFDVEQRYSPEDIRELDRQGRAQRNLNARSPNLLRLSQVLRFCGSYVDRLQGRLTRVSWQDQSDKIQSITVQFEPYEEHRNAKGDAHVTVIEELCIHVYKQRKKITSGVEKLWHRPAASASDGL